MKLAIGYQMMEPQGFAEIVRKYAANISEIYFAWPGEPSGRMPLGMDCAGGIATAQQQLEQDLTLFRSLGIRLNMLFNANCYGEWANSKALAQHVCQLVDSVQQRFGLGVVTTCSPLIAAVIKENFPEIATRASVNMRIGAIQAASALAPFFDEFHLQREYNRDIAYLAAFKNWCDKQGKQLHILANSGCMAFCAGQTFHDNLVAHEHAASQLVPSDFDPILCHHVYLDPANWVGILQSTWVRPEDLQHYEPYFTQVKLATRMHKNPELVIRAYAEQSFSGNLLDLLEPGHGPMLGGRQLDNQRFPTDWFARTSSCARNCHACSYCRETLELVLRER